jgi:drug/metabolite transporter (DMT)-like permease
MTAPAVPLVPAHARFLVPGLFVFLWSTGFIFGKIGVAYAEPFTLLSIRFAVVTLLMLAIALATAAPWPASTRQTGHYAVVGVLLHGGYLGGIFAALEVGLSPAVAALIVGLQPLLTATVVGPLLGERVTPRQWLGLALGFAGVVMVLSSKLAFDRAGLAGIAFATLSLVGITGATLYQKRYCAAMDWRSGAVVQYAAAAVAVAVVALLTEQGRVLWTGDFIFAMTWLVLVLSVGAVGLLNLLIRRGAAARVASLFYLVPPMAALEAYLIFGETLGPAALVGMGLAAIGVAMANRP